MRRKEENGELHSPEVRDILDKMPAWIIRWGTLIISLLVLVAVILGWKLFR